MRPGEKNSLILEKVMNDLGIEHTLKVSTAKDGIFFSAEVSSKQLIYNDSFLKNISITIRNKVKDNLCKLGYYDIYEECEVPRKINELFYDFILYKIEDGKISWCKTFEIQGEGHFSPCFGTNEFIKTLLSDEIKKEYSNTIMIPFIGCIDKESALKKIILKYI